MSEHLLLQYPLHGATSLFEVHPQVILLPNSIRVLKCHNSYSVLKQTCNTDLSPVWNKLEVPSLVEVSLSENLIPNKYGTSLARGGVELQGGPKNGTVFYCCFETLDISQGSVATHLRCGGIFSDNIIARFLLILTVK